MTSNPRSPWDVPSDSKDVVEDRGPVDAGDDRRREPTLRRDGYTVRSRRPECGRPGEIMSNERAAQRERFDDEYSAMRSGGPYETED
jgi:hypothetical protein